MPAVTASSLSGKTMKMKGRPKKAALGNTAARVRMVTTVSCLFQKREKSR